jgi:hypothetical protein
MSRQSTIGVCRAHKLTVLLEMNFMPHIQCGRIVQNQTTNVKTRIAERKHRINPSALR